MTIFGVRAMPYLLQIGQRTGRQVVHHQDMPAGLDQSLNQMAADEAGTAGD